LTAAGSFVLAKIQKLYLQLLPIMHDPQSSTNDQAERLADFPHRRFSGQGQTVVRQRG